MLISSREQCLFIFVPSKTQLKSWGRKSYIFKEKTNERMRLGGKNIWKLKSRSYLLVPRKELKHRNREREQIQLVPRDVGPGNRVPLLKALELETPNALPYLVWPDERFVFIFCTEFTRGFMLKPGPFWGPQWDPHMENSSDEWGIKIVHKGNLCPLSFLGSIFSEVKRRREVE